MTESSDTVTVTLYTWIPDPDYPGEKAFPLADLGHSALQVGDLYVSYWPELDHPISRLTQHLHPRTVRNPASLAEEIDPSGPYMRRPPEFVDLVEGLSLAAMRECWQTVQDSPYDVNDRNCSHGVLEVLKAGAPAEVVDDLDPDRAPLPNSDGIWSKLRAIVFRPFTDCIPEKLRAVVIEALEVETVKEPARQE
jgi:hypothetical protein